MNKVLLLILFFFGVFFGVKAQEKDSLGVSLNRFRLNLIHNPLPIRSDPLEYVPVVIKPEIANAKINYWTKISTIGLNINQAAFTDNWRGGGANSLSVGTKVNAKAEYNYKYYNYVSELILEYGRIKTRDQLPKKIVDRIYFDNKVAIQLSKRWYCFGSLNIESQFDYGYTYSVDAKGVEVATLTSKFMSPAYLTQSVGFEHKTTSFFSTRIGLGTLRQTFVLDTTLYKTNAQNFGVTPGKRSKNELAFQLVSNFEKEVMKNIAVKSKYSLFMSYDNLKKLNHRLDINMTAKVNKYISVSLTGIVLYDKNTTSKVQASQVLALGLSLSLPR